MDERISALQKAAAARTGVIGLAGGLPADELLPREDLGRALAHVVTTRDDALQYGWPEGVVRLRAWIADRLRRRGAQIDAERVIITAGAQQALAIAAAVLRDTTIAVGDATYPGALDAFRGAGVPIGVDSGEARYVIAGVTNPRGIAEDATAALATTGPLIVDEAYAELRFDGRLPRPLLADACDRTWHVGTISKTIAPGLRVGWLVPPAKHHAAALEHKQATDLQTASVCQAGLARLLATIDYDALLAKTRAFYQARAEQLACGLRQHLPGVRFVEPEGGFSIWVETDDDIDELAFLEAALDAGVMVDPGGPFSPVPRPSLAFRASYSSSSELDEAAKRLSVALTRAAREPRRTRPT
ncbi:MAG: PLP-dependent aminotransferase family protein [Kofleriaceae bacterium]|nr:PLP-dependent aminotransferase family protein [Kofleriaceae bacterium]